MNMLCYFIIYFCANYWCAAQAFWFVQPERTLEWQHGVLASKVLNNLADSHPHENVVFSPLSVHTAMTLVYLGAEGKTAQELYYALLPSTSNKKLIAQDYDRFAKTNLNRNFTDFELRMVSGLIVNRRYQIAESFYPLAAKLGTAVVPRYFRDGDNVVRSVNSAVEMLTNSKIRNILEPGSIDDSKTAVIINALYLRALWEIPFPEQYTRKQYFRLGGNKQVMVDMMVNQHVYRWAKIPKLNATLLELPYKNSNLTMLIVLPDRIDGLKDLEKRIKKENINWNHIADELTSSVVTIALPRFKIEFEMDVREQFEKLGVSTVFSNSADLSGLIGNNNYRASRLESVRHKAFLQVNEAGTEGAAATVGILLEKMLVKTIRVDHPFVFAIRNPDAVFFIGHVVKP